MFNEISPRYDLLNRLLSFGLDSHWRTALVKFLPLRNNLHLLDLATGTADVAITLCQKVPQITRAVGIDLADKMLEIGQTKIHQKGLEQTISLKHADALSIPFDNNSFDIATISFGIRNTPDHFKVLQEMNRILNPKGRALILEFSLPDNPLLRFSHLMYLRNIVPIIGWIVSGHYQAYRYLNKTIEDFPYGEAFCQLMSKAGFANSKAHPLLGGIATIYVGNKN